MYLDKLSEHFFPVAQRPLQQCNGNRRDCSDGLPTSWHGKPYWWGHFVILLLPGSCPNTLSQTYISPIDVFSNSGASLQAGHRWTFLTPYRITLILPGIPFSAVAFFKSLGILRPQFLGVFHLTSGFAAWVLATRPVLLTTAMLSHFDLCPPRGWDVFLQGYGQGDLAASVTTTHSPQIQLVAITGTNRQGNS